MRNSECKKTGHLLYSTDVRISEPTHLLLIKKIGYKAKIKYGKGKKMGNYLRDRILLGKIG